MERRLDMSGHELGWCRTYSLRAIVRPTPGERILVDNNVVDVSTLHSKILDAVVMPRFLDLILCAVAKQTLASQCIL